MIVEPAVVKSVSVRANTASQVNIESIYFVELNPMGISFVMTMIYLFINPNVKPTTAYLKMKLKFNYLSNWISKPLHNVDVAQK